MKILKLCLVMLVCLLTGSIHSLKQIESSLASPFANHQSVRMLGGSQLVSPPGAISSPNSPTNVANSALNAGFSSDQAPTFVDSNDQAESNPFGEVELPALSAEASKSKKEEPQDRELNADQFLSSFEVYNCDAPKPDEQTDINTVHVNFDNLCPQVIKSKTLYPLGNYDTPREKISEYLLNDIYNPLAMNMIQRDNVADLLNDVIFDATKNSLMDPHKTEFTYHSFQSKVLRSFEEITLKSQDFDHYRSDINDIIVAILKLFHLYWNTLRTTNQFDKARMDTKEILRVLLRSFDIKQKFLVQTTEALVNKIKEAYYRFVRAHRMMEVLNNNADDIIVHQIVRRYNNVNLAIKENKYTNIKLVREIDFLLRLVQLYHVVNYKRGVPEAVSIDNFTTNIIIRISNNFELLKSSISQADSASLRVIRDFTAIMLLKMKHINHIIFKFHFISEFVSLPLMYVEFNAKTTVKVYYEMFDNWLLIPKNCMSSLVLRSCAINEMQKTLRYISNKYSLTRSTSGWEFYDYIRNAYKGFFDRATEQTFNNWANFKHYFYTNMFAMMFNMKQKYHIVSLDALEQLETNVGQVIDRYRTQNLVSSIDFSLLDNLDKGLYDQFLDIKANFNVHGVESDPTMLSRVKKAIHDFLYDFLKESASRIDKNVIELANNIDKLIINWKGVPISEQTPLNIGNQKGILSTNVFNKEVVDTYQNQGGTLIALDSVSSGQPAVQFQRLNPLNIEEAAPDKLAQLQALLQAQGTNITAPTQGAGPTLAQGISSVTPPQTNAAITTASSAGIAAPTGQTSSETIQPSVQSETPVDQQINPAGEPPIEQSKAPEDQQLNPTEEPVVPQDTTEGTTENPPTEGTTDTQPTEETTENPPAEETAENSASDDGTLKEEATGETTTEGDQAPERKLLKTIHNNI